MRTRIFSGDMITQHFLLPPGSGKKQFADLRERAHLFTHR